MKCEKLIQESPVQMVLDEACQCYMWYKADTTSCETATAELVFCCYAHG